MKIFFTWKKAQAALENLLLIAGAILFVSILIVILLNISEAGKNEIPPKYLQYLCRLKGFGLCTGELVEYEEQLGFCIEESGLCNFSGFVGDFDCTNSVTGNDISKYIDCKQPEITCEDNRWNDPDEGWCCFSGDLTEPFCEITESDGCFVFQYFLKTGQMGSEYCGALKIAVPSCDFGEWCP
ncbi:MAG: hypothetical protein Q7K34_04470 [archaeon]|nr:hypothetical protein [archaeon]